MISVKVKSLRQSRVRFRILPDFKHLHDFKHGLDYSFVSFPWLSLKSPRCEFSSDIV